jgi:hypothetical protein
MDGVPGNAGWRACVGLAALVALCTEVGEVAAQDSAMTAQSQSALMPRVVVAQKLAREVSPRHAPSSTRTAISIGRRRGMDRLGRGTHSH